tara:strand:+ start:10496 stop:10852 length:357 start_codon:yes stop_codon:yes gene_type:complete
MFEPKIELLNNKLNNELKKDKLNKRKIRNLFNQLSILNKNIINNINSIQKQNLKNIKTIDNYNKEISIIDKDIKHYKNISSGSLERYNDYNTITQKALLENILLCGISIGFFSYYIYI